MFSKVLSLGDQKGRANSSIAKARTQTTNSPISFTVSMLPLCCVTDFIKFRSWVGGEKAYVCYW